jgi:hypothetical protein
MHRRSFALALLLLAAFPAITPAQADPRDSDRVVRYDLVMANFGRRDVPAAGQLLLITPYPPGAEFDGILVISDRFNNFITSIKLTYVLQSGSLSAGNGFNRLTGNDDFILMYHHDNRVVIGDFTWYLEPAGP